MGQRISRAKRTVSEVRFDQPGDVATVVRVLYLVFNEGYSGDVDLAAEAIRLTRQLATRIEHPEVAGLLALMLLHHARRPARTRADGSLVPLAEQDRTRWDTGLIAEGVEILQKALRPRPARRVPGAGRDRCPPRGRADSRRDRLGADRRVVRRARADHRQPDRPPQPGGGGRRGRRSPCGPGGAGRARPGAPPLHRRSRRTSTSATADRETAARLYAEAALAAPNLAERDHLTRQAARLNAQLHR